MRPPGVLVILIWLDRVLYGLRRVYVTRRFFTTAERRGASGNDEVGQAQASVNVDHRTRRAGRDGRGRGRTGSQEGGEGGTVYLGGSA